jgi:hypothetical protein
MFNKIFGSMIALIGALSFFYAGLKGYSYVESSYWGWTFVASFIFFIISILVMVID